MSVSNVHIAILTCFLLPAVAFADKGFSAYQKGKFEEAQAAYMEKLAKGGVDLDRGQLHLNLGAAAYRVEDYEGAKHAFGEALLSPNEKIQEQAHYNLGNALFQTGRTTAAQDIEATSNQWNAAIGHYESTLELNPQNSQAQRNLEFVKVQLENLKPPEEQQNQDDQQQEEENQDNPEDNEQPEDQNDPPPPEDEQEEPPSSQPPPPEEQDQSPEEDQSQPPPPSEPEERDWSPSDARRILENNADEDKDVKPEKMEQFSSEPFRNW